MHTPTGNDMYLKERQIERHISTDVHCLKNGQQYFSHKW